MDECEKFPWCESWVVLEGEVIVTADGEAHPAAGGDILAVGAGTPHQFRVAGVGRLRMMCLQASPRFLQENLEV